MPDDFVDSLNWQAFVVPPRPDLPAGVSPRGTRTAEQSRLLEGYYEELQEWREKVEIVTRAGTVLRLRNGACILVGHVNESLSGADDPANFDFEEIDALAVLW